MCRRRERWPGAALCVTVAALAAGTWAEAGPAELAAIAIIPSDPHPIVGEAISVAVVVENQGSFVSGSFDVALFRDSPVEPAVGSSADFTLTVASLDAGVRTTVVFDAIVSSTTGVWRTYAIADNGDVVAETDETNNVAGTLVEWHARPYLGTGCSAGRQGGAAAGLAGSLVLPILLAAFVFRRRAGVSVPGPGAQGASGPGRESDGAEGAPGGIR